RTCQQDHLAGLQRLRTYLAGRGLFRLLTINTRSRKRKSDPIIESIAETYREQGMITFEEAITYAIRLSERFCRRAIDYYAALRSIDSSAEDRRQKRATLCEDVRNWNLDTGYALDIIFDQEVTLHLLHNWVQFAEL